MTAKKSWIEDNLTFGNILTVASLGFAAAVSYSNFQTRLDMQEKLGAAQVVFDGKVRADIACLKEKINALENNAPLPDCRADHSLEVR